MSTPNPAEAITQLLDVNAELAAALAGVVGDRADQAAWDRAERVLDAARCLSGMLAEATFDEDRIIPPDAAAIVIRVTNDLADSGHSTVTLNALMAEGTTGSYAPWQSMAALEGLKFLAGWSGGARCEDDE